MSVILKIYRSRLVNDILMSSSFEEVKAKINENVSKLQLHKLSSKDIDKFKGGTLADLDELNQSVLSYEQHANIITAKIQLEELHNAL